MSETKCIKSHGSMLSAIASTSLAVLSACALPPRSATRLHDSGTAVDTAVDSPSDRVEVDVAADAIGDAAQDVTTDAGDASDTGVAPDAPAVARIAGRVRFLESGTLTVTFNGVARTFTAASGGAAIDFDVATAIPAMAHSITITGGTTTQTCSVILPSPAPMREAMVSGVEVRCVIAAQHQLTATDERSVDLPASDAPMPRPLTEVPAFVINQATPTSVLLSVSCSNVVFDSTNSLGVVEVAFIDEVSMQIAGRVAVRRPNGNTRTAALSTVTIMQLAPGPHRIRPVFWHYDATNTAAPPAHIVYGVRPERGITVASDGPLTTTFAAVLLDSLSTFERATITEWLPTAADAELTAGQQRSVPLSATPSITAGGGALYALVPPSAAGPTQWDLLADSTTLARGSSYYDDAELPHAMLAAQPSTTASAPMIGVRLTRFGYRNNFGPSDATVRFVGGLTSHFSGSPRFRAPQTSGRLAAATFGAGVRMLVARNSEGEWGTTGATMPTYAPPRTLAPIRLTLASPRRVLVFARIGTARVLSDGPTGDVRLVDRVGAMTTTLTTVSVQSSNAQNSQGLYLSVIADLAAGTHDLQVEARPVTSIGAIPPMGITTGYQVYFSPDLLVPSQPVGHIATGALVLE